MPNNIDHISSSELSYLSRIDVVKMTSEGNSSHVGSCLSCIDILAVLYKHILNYDPKNPRLPQRDIFIMSKGHAGAALYSILARTGNIDVSLLKTHYKNGGHLSGHVNSKLIDSIEVSSGSLGNGLGIGGGFSYSMKINSQNKRRVFVLISDGELNEGSTWEAVLFASHHKLKNLCCILDANNLQSIKSTTETLNVEPLKSKIKSFGWKVEEIDGHNHDEIRRVLKKKNSKPTFVIARTIKGKGVSFMENSTLWHYRNAQGEELKKAIKELSQ